MGGLYGGMQDGGALSPFPREPTGATPDAGALSPFPREPAGAAPPPFADSSKKALGGANSLSPFPLTALLNIELPDAFDKWRAGGYLTPPADQARCGACYVFAAVGQLADRISIATRRRRRHMLSAQYVVSCLQSRFQYGCGGTLDVPPVYAALLPGGFLGGTYLDSIFPYSGQQWDPKPNDDPESPCYYTPGAKECRPRSPAQPGGQMELPPNCYPPLPRTGMACTGTVPCDIAYIQRWYPDEPKYSFAEVFHLSENTNAGRLFPGSAAMEHFRLSVPVPMTPLQLRTNTRRIKEAVYRYGPVTAVIPVYSDFNEKFKIGHPAWNDADYVYEVDRRPDNQITGLHHVLIVGWGGGHWIIKNSWGVWWNADGYFNARMGDPLLLTESNCHSGLPFNPETGRAVEPFDHRPPRRAGGLLVVLLVVLVVLVVVGGLVLAALRRPKAETLRVAPETGK